MYSWSGCIFGLPSVSIIEFKLFANQADFKQNQWQIRVHFARKKTPKRYQSKRYLWQSTQPLFLELPECSLLYTCNFRYRRRGHPPTPVRSPSSSPCLWPWRHCPLTTWPRVEDNHWPYTVEWPCCFLLLSRDTRSLKFPEWKVWLPKKENRVKMHILI